jgi:5-methylcytosine-specific restriction endonuclease McrA
MAASRTGTTTWKRVREQAIRRAKKAGLTHCRHCEVLLDYERGRTPSSAEVDHLVPYSAGGKDHIDNTEVICRLCNQSKGNRAAPKQRPSQKRLKTSRDW